MRKILHEFSSPCCMFDSSHPGPPLASHIIPRAMHRPTKNSAGRNIAFSSNDREIDVDNQSDLKCKLLCFDCEQEFSRFETPAMRALQGAFDALDSADSPYELSASSIVPIALLVYSVFWRMAVASPRFSMPSSELASLRSAIANKSVFVLPTYPISISRPDLLKKLGSKIVISPWTDWRSLGVRQVRFVSFGLMFSMTCPLAPDDIASALDFEHCLDPSSRSGAVRPSTEFENTIFAGRLHPFKETAEMRYPAGIKS